MSGELIDTPKTKPNADASAASSARARPLRAILALLVAVASDAFSVAVELLPPVQIGIDLVTAVVLFAVLGFRWPLLPALIVEAIPGLSLFPTWTLAVGAIAFLGETPKRDAARSDGKRGTGG